MRDDRLARTLIRLYPRRWRERYQDEMLALVEDTGLDARVAVNLLAGSAREWLAEPPERGVALVLCVLIVAGTVNVSGALLGSAVRPIWTPPSDVGRWLTGSLRIVDVGAFFVFMRPWVTGASRRPLTLNSEAAAFLIGGFWLAVVVKAWVEYSLTIAFWRAHAFDILFDGAGFFVVMFLQAKARYENRPRRESLN